MWILVLSLFVGAMIALLLGYMRNRNLRKKLERGEIDRIPDVKEADIQCCGKHEVCEKESLLAAASGKIPYYDDEELDAYKGILSDGYTNEQAEEFREIFYTMRETDVAGWIRSLQLRGVNLPDELKDEVFLLIGERRE